MKNNKRYAAAGDKGFTVSEVAANVEKDIGKIDVLVHSLANGPEVTKPLLETSRNVSFLDGQMHGQAVCMYMYGLRVVCLNGQCHAMPARDVLSWICAMYVE